MSLKDENCQLGEAKMKYSSGKLESSVYILIG